METIPEAWPAKPELPPESEKTFNFWVEKLAPIVAKVIGLSLADIEINTPLQTSSQRTMSSMALRDELNWQVSLLVSGFGGTTFYSFINKAKTFGQLVEGVMNYEKFLQEPDHHPSLSNYL